MCVCVGVSTNIAETALILMVQSYLLKAEPMTLRCFLRGVYACVTVCEGRIECEPRCFDARNNSV